MTTFSKPFVFHFLGCGDAKAKHEIEKLNELKTNYESKLSVIDKQLEDMAGAEKDLNEIEKLDIKINDIGADISIIKVSLILIIKSIISIISILNG